MSDRQSLRLAQMHVAAAPRFVVKLIVSGLILLALALNASAQTPPWPGSGLVP